MTKFNKYEAFSITLEEALSEIVDEAISKKNSSLESANENFRRGYMLALHRVVTLIQQQAVLFDIPLEKLNLQNIKENDFIK